MGRELGGPPPSVGSSDAEDFQPMEIECFRNAAGVELEESGQPATTDPLANELASQAASAANPQFQKGALPPLAPLLLLCPHPFQVYS